MNHEWIGSKIDRHRISTQRCRISWNLAKGFSCLEHIWWCAREFPAEACRELNSRLSRKCVELNWSSEWNSKKTPNKSPYSDVTLFDIFWCRHLREDYLWFIISRMTLIAGLFLFHFIGAWAWVGASRICHRDISHCNSHSLQNTEIKASREKTIPSC